MSVPNAHAVQRPVPAINPTLTGATYSGTPNLPDPRIAVLASSTVGRAVPLVGAQPLSRLPAVDTDIINWTANIGTIVSAAVTPAITDTASVLNPDGTVYPGSPPPYVDRATLLIPQNAAAVPLRILPR